MMKSGPAVSIGTNKVTRIITVMIMLNAISRYLNFKTNAPIITYNKNKRKITLRQSKKKQGYIE